MSSPPWSADTDEVETGRRTGRTVAGKYRLLRLIGRGGMSEVYEAQHAVVGRRFAVKFLHSHLARSSSALQRFRREAEAAGALENEHIAAVVDFDTADDGAPFLVMEYLVGESLGELLQREGPLPLSRVVGALLQVCRGLEAAHRAGIVHRDLKPDNLFVTKRADGSDFLKILDFGIAKLNRAEARDLTRSGATLGTPFYMSPEQARGEKQLSERADIYSLGVILYELLSGEKPHPGDSYNAILAHILSRPVVPLETLRPGLPPGFSDLVARALSSSPEQRPASAAALADELAPFGGREVTAKQSQFELRAAPRRAATLPTPEAHTVEVPSERAAPMKPAPSAPLSDSAVPRRVALVPLLLALLVVTSIGLWLYARAPSGAPSQRAAPSAPPGAPVLNSELANQPALPADPPASAHSPAPIPPQAVTPVASAPTAVSRKERPSVRTATGRPATAPSSAPRPGASSEPPPPQKNDQPRVDFDEHNPY